MSGSEIVRSFAAGVRWAVVAVAVAAALAGCGKAGDPSSNGGSATGQGPFCPRGDRTGFDTSRLIGASADAASEDAAAHRCTIRIAIREGEALALTDDFQPRRINVAVENDEVTQIRGVF